jgi:CDP-glucose 4,6-dehydratase
VGVGQSPLENLVGMPFGNIFAGKRVLVTGHTGFKGSGLCEWLLALGVDDIHDFVRSR